MNTTSALALEPARAKVTQKSSPARLFYTTAALVLLALTVIGFQQFYLHGRAVGGRQISPRILPLVVIHGVLMSSWIILFLLQPILVVSGHRRQHMMLGRMGAVLAAAIVVTGVVVAVESVRAHPEGHLWGLTQRQFMAIPLTALVKFLVFVSLGVWMRRQPEIHRPMMLLATLAVVQAATARIAFLTSFYKNGLWGYLVGPALPILVLGALFLVAHWLLTRRFDRWYALGYAGLLITSPLIMFLARSSAWDHFATLLLRCHI
jgi:hypothetical protein